jgi:7-cyano-7-deazaguanine synthase
MVKTLHLLSGGLDSVTMLYQLVADGTTVECLLFDYKQRHKQELQFATSHARRLRVPFHVVDLPQLGGMNEQSWIVPNRNAIFLSVAVNVATQLDCKTVTIGCNKDDADYFPDCRQDFINKMNMAVMSAGYNVHIVAPFISMMKWEIMARARELGVDWREIWTCYSPTESGPCGECMACKKLEAACGR